MDPPGCFPSVGLVGAGAGVCVCGGVLIQLCHTSWRNPLITNPLMCDKAGLQRCRQCLDPAMLIIF